MNWRESYRTKPSTIKLVLKGHGLPYQGRDIFTDAPGTITLLVLFTRHEVVQQHQPKVSRVARPCLVRLVKFS